MYGFLWGPQNEVSPLCKGELVNAFASLKNFFLSEQRSTFIMLFLGHLSSKPLLGMDAICKS